MGHEDMLTIIQKCSQPVTVSLLFDHTQLLSEDTNNSNPSNSDQREQNLHCQSFNHQDLSYVEIDLLRLHIGIKIHLNWSSDQCSYVFVFYNSNVLEHKQCNLTRLSNY